MVLIYAVENADRIVRREPGPGTGETIYTTADGRRWRERLGPFLSQGTGVVSGYVDGDRMRVQR